MKAVLVRHGETEYNAKGIFQGYTAVPLSARGERQAARVAERLRRLRPQVLYSSDIARARQTAAIIGAHLGLPVRLCPGLREWHVGRWAGQPAAAFAAHLQALGAHPATYVPEGGESQVQTQARIVAQMEALAAQHAGETVLCVSHGKAIDLFVRHVLGLDVMRPPAYHIANASVTLVTWQEGAWEVVTLNEVCHLEGLDETGRPAGEG
ncbi:MAG: phosphoglycerate mutase [Candidatus Tectimicrobiota bacterium]|nr:MAG: phosphoglycerate mutase [Candidatus Tectomicrobia bacterium]